MIMIKMFWKKLIVLRPLLCVFFSVVITVGEVARGDSVTTNGVTWTFERMDGGVSLGGGTVSLPAIDTSVDGELVIPERIDGLKVLKIGNYAFRDCRRLTSVSMPSCVVEIGEGAFYNCYRLSNISLSTNVVEIGCWAFYDCRELRSINIPHGVKKIKALLRS